MLLRQLEYLTALPRERHFGRAADSCQISQPALSAGIRKLENELDVKIVQRGQRFEGFTAEGERVLRWGQRILADREVLNQTLSQMKEGLTGTLRIGAIPTAMSVSTLVTAPMREKHPMVRFSLASMSSREIAARLNDFDIDVGMTYVDGEPMGRVRVVPLYRERYMFLTAADADFANCRRLTWQDAATTPLCLLNTSMQNRRVIDGIFAEFGADPQPIVETDTVSDIYAHVVTMGVSSIVPHAWLHTFGVPEGTRVIPLDQPSRTLNVGLVLAGAGPESLLARALIDVARRLNLHELLNRSVADLLGSATMESPEKVKPMGAIPDPA